MNRDAKRINPSMRPRIEIAKGHIRAAKKPFDGSGYAFRTALAELRKAGMKIKYVPEKAHYIKVEE